MWGAGITGLHGEDLVLEEAEQFRAQLGTGVYSRDANSSEGQYRGIFGYLLALIRNAGNWIVWNANPGICEDPDVLALWEEQVGLRVAPRGWTIEQRRDRMRTWLKTPMTSNPAQVLLFIESRWGIGTYFWALDEFTDDMGGNTFAFLVTMTAAFWDDTARVQELETYLDRICPAHLEWFTVPI